jgi:heptaprenyl diphosphate synthase
LDIDLERELKARLAEVEGVIHQSVRSDVEFVDEAARYLVQAGGKRLRPLMVLLSGYFGDSGDPRLIAGAAVIEITHLATLYHDDVIDEATERRGIESVNARWGNRIAVRTGSFLFARAVERAADLGDDVVRLLSRTITLACEGQIRELAAWGRTDQEKDAYLQVILRKTAALIAASCRLGGMLSNATPERIELLDGLGLAIGMGFQLSDDIMDLIATREELRKEPGQDLRQGIYTLPVMCALADEAVGPELRELLQEAPPDGTRLERAIQLVTSEDPLAEARQAVTEQARRAKALASGLPEQSARRMLCDLADYVAVRCGAYA